MATARKAGVIKKLLKTDHQLREGESCHHCMVNLLKVQVCDDYQRKYDPNHTINQRGSYDGLNDQAPICSYRDGVLWVPEGQHRIRINVNNGRNERQCVVFFGLTLEREAQVFYGENHLKKRPNEWVTFKAALHSRRVQEETIYEACKAAKLRTPVDYSKGQSDCTSTTALRDMVNVGKPHLEKVLKVLSRAFRVNGKKGPLQDAAKRIAFQRGLSQFIRHNPDFTLTELVEAFKEPQNNAGNLWHDAQVIVTKMKKDRVDAKQVEEAMEAAFFAGGHLVWADAA